eukprot:Awhi_evm1s15145
MSTERTNCECDVTKCSCRECSAIYCNKRRTSENLKTITRAKSKVKIRKLWISLIAPVKDMNTDVTMSEKTTHNLRICKEHIYEINQLEEL